MDYLQLVLGTYFLTSVLYRTDGPYGVLYKLRKNEDLPFYCFACLVIYMALICVLISFYIDQGILVISVAGAALLLNDLRERLV